MNWFSTALHMAIGGEDGSLGPVAGVPERDGRD